MPTSEQPVVFGVSLGCKSGIYLYTRGVVQSVGVGAYDIWGDLGIGIPHKVYLGSAILGKMFFHILVEVK